MPANRFFIQSPFKSGSPLLLEGVEHHHLTHVMRLTEGEKIEIINGLGDLANAKILEVKKKETTVQILETTHHPEEKPPLFLGIPLMRASKLEWVIEKGTELGANAFFIYTADASEKDSLSSHQLERLHLIATSALKQSGRFHLPSIEVVPALSSLLKKNALYLFGDLHCTNPLHMPSLPPSPILFISGPEKGFSEKELALLKEQAKGMRLSAYILRAETAPIAALSLLAVNRIVSY